MPEHTFEMDRATAVDEHDQVVMPKGGDRPRAREQHLDPEAAWAQVEEILANRRGVERLPFLAAQLDEEHKAQLVTTRVEDLRRVCPGDTLLEVARAMDDAATSVTYNALHGTPPVTAAKLRLYLRSLQGKELVTITGMAFNEMRLLLKGPLLQEIPSVAQQLYDLGSHAGFVRWYVDTTEPRSCAISLARTADGMWAKTLDAEGLWGWLDELPTGQAYEGLVDLAAETQNAAARDKLLALAGPLAQTTDAAQRSENRKPHHDELVSELDGPMTRERLLELVAAGKNEGGGVEIEAITRQLRRLRAPADDVLAVLDALRLDLRTSLPVLLETKAVTRDHILTFLSRYLSDEILSALVDDRTRRSFRKAVGKPLRIHDLIGYMYVEVRDKLLSDEALWQWFLDDSTPDELLWFCGEAGELRPRAIRCVQSRRGFDWVYRLTSSADDRALRALALNVGDPAVARYIRGALLADRTFDDPSVTTPEAIDPAVLSGARSRLTEAIKTAAPEDVLARLADLAPPERSRVARDNAQVELVLASVNRSDMVRAVTLLDLRFGEVIAAVPARGEAHDLVPYLQTRPATEESAVLELPTMVEHALKHVHPDPLLVFPSLVDSKRLLRAIQRTPTLIGYLLRADSSRTLRTLTRDDVLPKVLPLLTEYPEVMDQLPRYQHLDERGQKAFDHLVETVPSDEELFDTADEIQSGTYDGDPKAAKEGARLDAARRQNSLVDAINLLASQRAAPSTVLQVLRGRSSEVPALLSDAGHWSTVAGLRDLVGQPPDVVFPEISIDRLMQLQNARRWLLGTGNAFLVLEAIGSNAPAQAALARALDEDLPGARDWLDRLPVSSGLTDSEELALDRIQQKSQDADVLRSLFQVRFGMPAPITYDTATVRRLYQTVCRLPDAHLQQQRIKAFLDINAGENAGGYWDPKTEVIVIDDDVKPGSGKDVSNKDAPWLTGAKMQELYGFDAAAIASQVQAGRVAKRVEAGVEQFQLREVAIDQFTSTVLHEVGHSVDDILGSRTDVIFGAAGWRQYMEADFETWAAEMGGWDRVTATDKSAIRQVWLDAMRSNTAVADLVPSDHPAMAERYSNIGIVSVARQRKRCHYEERTQVGDRVFVVQPHYASFFSLSAKAAAVAPTNYTLYAPAEYFAECYVEYYREVDGTAAGQKKKGGALPTWIKTWFDANVDRIGFDPKRMEGDEG